MLLEPEMDNEEIINNHILTLQQYEQGLIDILGEEPVVYEKDDFDVDTDQNEIDPQRELEQIKTENEILQSELQQETKRRKELQNIIVNLTEDSKRKDLTLDYLSKTKQENDELLSTVFYFYMFRNPSIFISWTQEIY